MSDKPEDSAKEKDSRRILELRAKLEKELIALLAHPLVPEEFKDVFEDRNSYE